MSEQKSTAVTVPATDVHRNFGELLRRAFTGQEHFIVEKDRLPVVVIISKAEYDSLMEEREAQDKARRLKEFRESARAIGEEIEKLGLTEDELMAKLEETKQQVYQEYYGDKSTK
jgi:prevent-host-death family protein